MAGQRETIEIGLCLYSENVFLKCQKDLPPAHSVIHSLEL